MLNTSRLFEIQPPQGRGGSSALSIRDKHWPSLCLCACVCILKIEISESRQTKVAYKHSGTLQCVAGPISTDLRRCLNVATLCHGHDTLVQCYAIPAVGPLRTAMQDKQGKTGPISHSWLRIGWATTTDVIPVPNSMTFWTRRTSLEINRHSCS